MRNVERSAYPVERYPARTRSAAVVQLMIMNNLDPRVAQFPHELVTYGANGQVFSNWAQVRSVWRGQKPTLTRISLQILTS